MQSQVTRLCIESSRLFLDCLTQDLLQKMIGSLIRLYAGDYEKIHIDLGKVQTISCVTAQLG